MAEGCVKTEQILRRLISVKNQSPHVKNAAVAGQTQEDSHLKQLQGTMPTNN